MVARYQNRISSPILDRIDIHLEVPCVPIAKLASLDSGESSSVIRERVEPARNIQQARFTELGKPSVLVNGDMRPDEAGRQLLRNAAARLNLSARAYHRILKLARTMTDLVGEEHVPQDLAEALQYRPRGNT